jgi:hypothetical protein
MNIRSLFWSTFSIGVYFVYHSLAVKFIDLNTWIDNYRYSWFYEFVVDVDQIPEIIYHGTVNLGMSEVLPLSIFKIFSILSINYGCFIAIVNSVFFLALVTLFVRYFRLHPFVAIILIVSNFYVFKLMFTLHKLKIAILFFLLLLIYLKQARARLYSLLLVGFVAHYQMIILTPIALFKSIQGFKAKMAFLIVLLPVVFLLSSVFIVKFAYYFRGFEYIDFIVSLFFVFLLSPFLRRESYKYLSPVLLAVLFFGNSRLNILLYFITVVYMKDRKIAFFLLTFPNIWFWYKLSLIV